MKRIETRGIIVYMSPQGEANRRVGLYTEEGMRYFTIYGARSAKGHFKSSLTLFSMGNFIFTLKKQNIYSFVDAQIFEHSRALADNLEVYYAACAGAEIVKIAVGAEHELQFKVFVNFLLYLINNTNGWRGALILFLWRCLVYNGWQPDIPPRSEVQSQNTEVATAPWSPNQQQTTHSSLAESDRMSINAKSDFTAEAKSTLHTADRLFLRYTFTEGFFLASAQDFQVFNDIVEYIVVESLLQSNEKSYKEYSNMLNTLEIPVLQTLINLLFTIWQHSIGHKLTLSEFMVH